MKESGKSGSKQRKGKNPVDSLRLGAVEEEKKTKPGLPVKTANCTHRKRCGGCQYSELPYAEQLGIKEKRVRRLLGAFGPVQPIVGAEEPLYYRNKVTASFGFRNGKTIMGIYEQSTHKIVPIDHCLIQNREADRVTHIIRKLCISFKLKAYDEATGYGLLRHVMVRTAHRTGEIMVVLVTVSPILPSAKNFVKALRERCPEITTVIQNINPQRTSMVLGPREKVLFGKGYIEDVLCGLRFRISSGSFYQVNPVQTERLYQTALALAGLKKTEIVLDAYCGVGTIGMIASQFAGEVIGVELNGDAVRDAKVNARQNQIDNISFYANDAGVFLDDLSRTGKRIDVIFMDPPRTGSTEAFIESACGVRPSRIVYISCNPETLARDLRIFKRYRYKAEVIIPVDQFPLTEHVETVVLLSKGEVDSKKIRLEFSLEDMDMSEFQDGATYTQIKDYVLEHSGLKVSNLYISQIKRKCGIGVGKNYNLPKSEDSRQPQCPPEKEKAIREAFKYFGMI